MLIPRVSPPSVSIPAIFEVIEALAESCHSTTRAVIHRHKSHSVGVREVCESIMFGLSPTGTCIWYTSDMRDSQTRRGNSILTCLCEEIGVIPPEMWYLLRISTEPSEPTRVQTPVMRQLAQM